MNYWTDGPPYIPVCLLMSLSLCLLQTMCAIEAQLENMLGTFHCQMRGKRTLLHQMCYCTYCRDLPSLVIQVANISYLAREVAKVCVTYLKWESSLYLKPSTCPHDTRAFRPTRGGA